MFSTEVTLLSEEYQHLQAHYTQGVHSLDSSSVEGLILRIVLFQADNREDIPIHPFIQKLGQHKVALLFVANLLARELFKELGMGPSSTAIKVEELPQVTKWELEFRPRSSFAAPVQFHQLIEQLGLQGMLPDNISSYNAEFLHCSTFVNFRKSHLTKELSLEGQTWIHTTPYPQLLLTLKEILDHLQPQPDFNEFYTLLVKARLSFLHNQVLNLPVGSLTSATLTSYKSYFKLMFRKERPISSEHYISLQLEYFNALLFAYKYTEAENVLEQCKRALNMDVEFTGKMGKRTKYQEFETPQLVMNITQWKEKEPEKEQGSEEMNHDLDEIPPEELNLTPAKQLLQLDSDLQQQPQSIALESDSILFETPKLNEQQKPFELHFLKQLVLLNVIYYNYETTPRDQILFLQIQSMISPLLESLTEHSPYSLRYSALALRSLNELPRYKNSDRALQQLQQLVQEYNKLKSCDSSFSLCTPSNYRVHLVFVKTVAEKVMQFGLMMTGVEMYNKAGMYEECVEGMVAAGNRTKAMALAKNLLEEQGNEPSPRLLCLMGDATGEVEYYERSWEQSKKTFARAQRTLGRLYFSKKDFQKCIQSFKKSLEVNYYNPSSWFTLGCAYLNLNQFSDASKAFSQSINIDDSQGEAWGNLASCYIALKKFDQAYGALDHALKHSENNWKIWANMMGISLKVKKFFKFMESISKLVVLDMTKLVTEDVLEKMNQVLKYKTALIGEERKRYIGSCKKRLEETYETLKTALGSKAYLWRQYASFLKLQIAYLKEMSTHYLHLHSSNTIDPNDLFQQYKDPAQIQSWTKTMVTQLSQQVVQSKQKQLNMGMALGWESDKTKREEVSKILQEYKEAYLGLHGEGDEDYQTFVKSVSQKL